MANTEAERWLKEANEIFAKALMERDMDTLLSLHREDCMVRGDGMEPFIGHEGVKMHAKALREKLNIDKLIMDTDTLWETHFLSPTAAIDCCAWDIYTLQGKRIKVFDLIMWKLTDGKWKVYRGCWTT